MIRSVPQFQTLPPALVPYAMLVNHSLPLLLHQARNTTPFIRVDTSYPKNSSCSSPARRRRVLMLCGLSNLHAIRVGEVLLPLRLCFVFFCSPFCFVALLVSSFAALFLLLSSVFRTNLPPFSSFSLGIVVQSTQEVS